MSVTVQTVSQFIQQVKSLLEGNFQEVYVKGEVTNLSSSATGHWYFSLSDKSSTVSCALFKMDAYRNPEIRILKNGDEIEVIGSLGLYARRGSFQIIAKKIIKQGRGSLQERYEQLKKKLASEGLFDLDRKISIPKFPKKIAIITAPGAAALQDFFNIMMRRSFSYNLVLVPSLVQGDAAPKELIKAFKKIESVGDFDLIVLTRGGGSLEDLWAFNNEALARVISKCEVPVISAVGHQVDFSLSDFVADLRCETPSAAAEVISQFQIDLTKEVDHLWSRFNSLLPNLINLYKTKIEDYHPTKIYGIIVDRFKKVKERLDRCSLKNREHELIGMHEYQLRLDEAIAKLTQSATNTQNDYKVRIDRQYELLNALSPDSVLGRGYSYVADDHGRVIDSSLLFDKMKSKEKITIKFKDGKRYAQKI
jgi:exodeoxyribonuclease VII large subunit